MRRSRVFFGRLRCEIGVELFATRAWSRAAVFEDLEVFSNCVRRHSALGYVSSAEFERARHQTRR